VNNNEIYTGTDINWKKIAENHKRLIFSKSKENIGAEFHVILPM
jgi:two-component system CheB/CheR fusion protein